MDKLVLKIINEIAPDEIDRITSITGFAVLIAKIIEKAHRKKNLSYDDSKKLVELVVDTLIKSLEGRDIPPDLRITLDFVRDHRMVFIEIIDDVILVWDVVVPKIKKCCGCFGRRKKRMTKSFLDAKKSDIKITVV